MKFEINTSDITFNGRGLKQFFTSINQVSTHFEVKYFVVGAFARDIILGNIFNEPTNIATRDIDIAITIQNWEKYSEFINYLITHHNFRRGKNAHEYYSPAF